MKETFNAVAFNSSTPTHDDSFPPKPRNSFWKGWTNWIVGIEGLEEARAAEECYRMQEVPFQYVHKGLVCFFLIP